MTPLDDQNQSSPPAPVLQNELLPKIRSLVELPLPEYGDNGAECARCFVSVCVHDGCEWENGDMCDSCAQVVIGEIRQLLRNAPSPAPDVQRLQQEARIAKLESCLESCREEFAGHVMQFDDGDIDAADYITQALEEKETQPDLHPRPTDGALAFDSLGRATRQPECEERVIAKIRQRREKGRHKYGATMDRTDLEHADWIKHAQEEAMDLAIYLERLL